jgi:uncharacterized protein YegL
MTNTDDIPNVDYVTNTAPRLPCVLIVDGSDSMQGARIDQLNEGLKLFAEELKKDPTTRTGVRLKVIRAGGSVDELIDWTDAKDFAAPSVSAHGGTPLGSAVLKALDEIEAEKTRMDAADIVRKRAWLFVFTDGEPTDTEGQNGLPSPWANAAKRCREMERKGTISCYGVGVDGANTSRLSELSSENSPAMLQNIDFKPFFKFLTKSIKAGSMATKGETIPATGQTPWVFKA